MNTGGKVVLWGSGLAILAYGLARFMSPLQDRRVVLDEGDGYRLIIAGRWDPNMLAWKGRQLYWIEMNRLGVLHTEGPYFTPEEAKAQLPGLLGTG